MDRKLVLGVVALFVLASSVVVVYASPVTLDELKAWVDLWHLVDWTPVKNVVFSISEKVDIEVAHECLDVEVQTLNYDESIIPIGIMYSTVIGGFDDCSDAYVLISFRGERVDATVTLTVMDGGKYSWTNQIVYSLQTGVYDAFIEAGSGVAVGSYLVVVEAT